MALTVAQTADAGAPQAGITIDGLSTSTACTVVVTVSWNGGVTWNPVRGGSLTGVLGSAFVRDYVPALNVPATYRAVVTGGTTVTWTTTTTIPSALAWIQDPLAPRSAVSFTTRRIAGSMELMAGSFAEAKRPQAIDRAVPIGARIPVASIGLRQVPMDVPLILGAAAAQNTAYLALVALLDSAGQVVLRGLPAESPFDPVVHVTVDAPSTMTMRGKSAYNEMPLVVSQVQPVTMRIVIPWWTCDQVLALVQSQLGVGATCAQVLAAQPTGKTCTSWVANPGVAS